MVILFVSFIVAGPGASLSAFADDDDGAHLVRGAEISLLEAIRTAEAHKEGRAFKAEVDDDSFTPTYEVSVATDSVMFEVRVHAETGKVLSAREDDDTIPAERSVKLEDVVLAAEEAHDGTAYEASCEDDRFDDDCEVELVAGDGKIYEVVVDGGTGNIVRSRLEED